MHETPGIAEAFNSQLFLNYSSDENDSQKLFHIVETVMSTTLFNKI